MNSCPHCDYVSTEADLTPRQRQFLIEVLHGSRDHEIAAKFGVARQTVRNSLHRAYRRIGVTSRTAAAAWARKENLQ